MLSLATFSSVAEQGSLLQRLAEPALNSAPFPQGSLAAAPVHD
jgi:hypothetical protein